MIHHRVAAGNLESVRELVLDWYADGESARDNVIAGIMGDSRSRDWEFSMAALQVLIERADEFQTPSADLGALLVRKFGGYDAQFTDPSQMLVFEGERTNILLVRTEQGLKLAFWESLRALEN